MLAQVPHDEAVASLAESKRCDRVVFYDDTWRGIPEFQRGKLSHTCTYERVLYTAALASRSVPSVALLRRTPSPFELGRAREIALDGSFQVLLLQGDCPDLTQETGESLLERWAASSSGERSVSQAERLIPGLLRQSDLVLPYQTLQWHGQTWGGQATFPDPTHVHSRKDVAMGAMRSLGLGEHVPRSVTIVRGPARETVARTIQMVDELQASGSKAYIKLSQRGVAGLANVVPATNCEVYDSTKPASRRARLLEKIARRRSIDLVTETVSVEERVNKSVDALGGLEYTVGGLLVDGKFSHTYTGRNLNTVDDSTSELLHSTSTRLLGLSNARQQLLATTARRVFEGLASTGYTCGYAYADCILSSEGTFVFTDFNLRRGLRSSGEAVLASSGGSWLDMTVRHVRPPISPTLTSMTAELRRLDAHWYGSPGYVDHKRVSILVPADGVVIRGSSFALHA